MSFHTKTMKWRPIETAPKNGNTIILGNATEVSFGQWDEAPRMQGDTYGPCWMSDICEDNWYSYALHFTPTHWMPLPPLPLNVNT